MSPTTLWCLLAGVAVALELMSGTFYLLMLALGLGAGAVAAYWDASTTTQLVVAAVVSSLAVGLTQQWRRKHPAALPAQSNPDVNLDIGQVVVVDNWSPEGTGQTYYRGAQWAVVLAKPLAPATAGRYRISAIQGSRLLVLPE